MIPLFGPIPGGIELFVVFIVAIMMFGLPLTIFGGLFLMYKRSKSSASKEDVDELKREVSKLREQVKKKDE